MAWTAPTTRSTGDLITASIWNVDLKDNLVYLKTKEVWTPAFPGSGAVAGYMGSFPVARLDAQFDTANMALRCPDDFLSLTEAAIIVIPRASQASANWDTTSEYAASGQAYATHTETNTTSTYNVTDEQLFEVDVSGILDDVSAGDYIAVRIIQGTVGHDLDVVGLFIKYA